MQQKTLAEKIIGSHTAKGEVSAGEVVIVKVDYTFSHDAAGPLLINQVQKLKAGTLGRIRRQDYLFHRPCSTEPDEGAFKRSGYRKELFHEQRSDSVRCWKWHLPSGNG